MRTGVSRKWTSVIGAGLMAFAAAMAWPNADAHALAPSHTDAGAFAIDDQQVLEERWYVVKLNDQRCGSMVSRTIKQRDNILTSSDMSFSIKRGPLNINIAMNTEFEETADGKPVRMLIKQQLGTMGATETVTTFKGDEAEIVSTSAGQKTSRIEKLPKGEWMTPYKGEQYTKAQLAKGEKTIAFTTIDPSGGLKLVTMTRTLTEKTKVETMGKTVPGLKWELTVSNMPNIKSSDVTDEQGRTLSSLTDLGGMKLTMIAADKELALSKLDAPELLVATLVTPDKPIKNPRATKSATYVLSVGEGELSDIPEGPGQSFKRTDAKSGRLTSAVDPAPVSDADLKDPAYLAPTAMLNHKDPELIKLLDQARKGKKEVSAEDLRRFVHEFIEQKDMSVGFASASETARTKVGDCTEHACLLAALLRGAGIPSRCVSGLVYADQFQGREGIFGYHMWTQAQLKVDGQLKWVNLDATLSDATPYDATHIALGYSSLADGEMQNFMVNLAPLIGRLRISVEKVD